MSLFKDFVHNILSFGPSRPPPLGEGIIVRALPQGGAGRGLLLIYKRYNSLSVSYGSVAKLIAVFLMDSMGTRYQISSCPPNEYPSSR